MSRNANPNLKYDRFFVNHPPDFTGATWTGRTACGSSSIAIAATQVETTSLIFVTGQGGQAGLAGGGGLPTVVTSLVSGVGFCLIQPTSIAVTSGFVSWFVVNGKGG